MDRRHNKPNGDPCPHPHNGLRCRYCSYVVPLAERDDGEGYVRRKEAEAVATIRARLVIGACVLVAMVLLARVVFLLLGGGS